MTSGICYRTQCIDWLDSGCCSYVCLRRLLEGFHTERVAGWTSVVNVHVHAVWEVIIVIAVHCRDCES